jgi:hypothetical protein
MSGLLILESDNILINLRTFQPMPCFYVYAPLYQKNSNGIRMLYTLSELIRKHGHKSKVICYEQEREDYDTLMPARYKEHTIKLDSKFDNEFELDDDDIVIYPETISDNPLKALNVVRYLLNRPMYLSGKGIEYGIRDYLVAYSLRVDSNLPQLFILNDDREYFYPIDFHDKQSLVCIYYGKVIDPAIRDQNLQDLINTFQEKVVITREFPRTRTELGELLRKSRLLVSLDPISNITYEATLCGTPALIVNDIFEFSSQKFNINLYAIINNPNAYDEAIKDVNLAFNQYKTVLQNNDESVKKFVKSVIAHFKTIDSEKLQIDSSIYSESIAARNHTQREIDELRYLVHLNSQGFSKVKISNSDYLNPIGRFLRNILIVTGTKRFFIQGYIRLKGWILNKKWLAKFFYRL